MGSCLCKGHKEIHLPMTVLQDQTEEGQLYNVKDSQSPSNRNVPDKSGHYGIGELATSSLIGLVATIKDHITKPTAMAQGRVAHLIEWKGWGGGGGSEAGGHGGGGWGGMEDHEFYSQMTDEIKEARFAAGVAEQFALAEAAMHVWSLNDVIEGPSTSLQGQTYTAAQSHFLSDFLLDGGSIGIPQHLHNIHTQSCAPCRAAAHLFSVPQVQSISPTLSTQQDNNQRPPEDRITVVTEAVVRHVDSSSQSEDDVFYN